MIDRQGNNVLSKVKSFVRNFRTNQLRSKLHSIIEESDRRLLNSFAVAREKVYNYIDSMHLVKTTMLTLLNSKYQLLKVIQIEDKGKCKTVLSTKRQEQLKEKKDKTEIKEY